MLSGRRDQYRLNPWSENAAESFGGETLTSSSSVSDMEKEMIKDALIKTRGNKRKAAKLLGLSERTLYRKINKYGLRDDEI